MRNLIITPQCLVDIIKEITQEFLVIRFKHKYKCYLKIDYEILEEDGFFNIQITKCSSGSPDFKELFANISEKYLDIEESDKKLVVATIEKKTKHKFKTQKVVYKGDSSFKLIHFRKDNEQKKFSALKSYTSLKLLFKIKDYEFIEFSPLLLDYFKEIEAIDSNIKISYRQDMNYIYRNRIPMDDIVLSCKILSYSLTQIFQNSQNEDFKKNLLNLLGIKNSIKFEETVGCLLLAQVHYNFKCPELKKKN